MRFRFTEQQQILRESIRNILEKEFPISRLRQIEESEDDYCIDVYRKLSELGYLAIWMPQIYGGAGGSVMDETILHEEFGRRLFNSPHLETADIVSRLMIEAGNEQMKKRYLKEIAEGKVRFAIARYEDKGEDFSILETRIESRAGRYFLWGKKLFVPFAKSVEKMLVTVSQKFYKTDNRAVMCMVDSNSEGISTEPMSTISGDKVYEVIFDSVEVDDEDIFYGGSDLIERFLRIKNEAMLFYAAEMVGGAEAALQMATDYARQRIQFDRPIGSFQAIKHMLARCSTELEATKLLIYYSAWSRDSGLKESTRLACMAKFASNRTYQMITKAGHQVMGGFGFMKEADMQLYYRRAKAMQMFAGNEQQLVRDICRML